MLRALRSFMVLALIAPALSAAPNRTICATPSPDEATAQWIEGLIRNLGQQKDWAAKAATVRVPVVFHNIHAGKEGKVSDQNIQALVNTLNEGFAGTPFEFYLFKTDRTNNKTWYKKCYEVKMENRIKQSLALTPQKYLNIYSCSLDNGNVLGFAYLPFFFPERSFLHGVMLDHLALPGSGDPDYGVKGAVAVHEVGHYLGLWHTFQGGCADKDEVADTPAQISPPQFRCTPVDSCPQQPGLDDVHNFMSYVPREECYEHFTPLQVERMKTLTAMFRPGLTK